MEDIEEKVAKVLYEDFLTADQIRRVEQYIQGTNEPISVAALKLGYVTDNTLNTIRLVIESDEFIGYVGTAIRAAKESIRRASHAITAYETDIFGLPPHIASVDYIRRH